MTALPEEGAVLVITDDPSEWAPRVADRNASGHRTALLVAEAGDPTAAERAAIMAEEMFAGAPWRVVDLRGRV